MRGNGGRVVAGAEVNPVSGSFPPPWDSALCVSAVYLGTGSELGQKRAVDIGRPLKKALTE
jgi:hypothetical protein